MNSGKILLLLPALNEEAALEKLASEAPPGYDVLLVDSGSTDRTVELAKAAGFKVIGVRYGRGQGSGIRTGMEYFLENGYEYLVTADCDYTDVLSGLPVVVDFLRFGGYDIVLGVRDFKKQRDYLGLTSIFVKKTVSILIRALMGIKARDMLTGVWCFDAKAVREIAPHLQERGFEYGFEILYHAWRLHLRIGESGVDFRRRAGETKLTLRQRLIQVLYGIKYGLKVVSWRLFGPGRKI
ncbi:MAG: glycosyltransferase family 2 protein [Candidatus Altiarchaeota archaeon]